MRECMRSMREACVCVSVTQVAARHACAPHPYTKHHKIQAAPNLLSSQYFILVYTQGAPLIYSLQEPVPWETGLFLSS